MCLYLCPVACALGDFHFLSTRLGLVSYPDRFKNWAGYETILGPCGIMAVHSLGSCGSLCVCVCVFPGTLVIVRPSFRRTTEGIWEENYTEKF